MRSLKRRLEALEARLTRHAVKLTMQDGTVHVLRYSGDELLQLFVGTMASGAELQGNALLLAQAAHVEEEDGSHFCELFSAVYRSPFPEISESNGLLQ